MPRLLIIQYALGVGGGGMQAARLADRLGPGWDVDILPVSQPVGGASRRVRVARVLDPAACSPLALMVRASGPYDHIDAAYPSNARHCELVEAARAANPAATLAVRFHAEAAFTSVWPRGALRSRVAGIIAGADALIFHHRRQAVEVLADLRLTRLAARVCLVRPGVDVHRFRPGGSSPSAVAMYARRFGLVRRDGSRRLVVAMAGRPAGEKNWHDYAVLCRRLVDELGADRVRCLAITGRDGRAEGVLPQFRQFVADLGSPLTITGLLADYENLLCQADVYVQTSCTESFCRTAAEAAACGCPVVATKVGGLEALAVRDGRTGLLIEPENGHRWLARLTAGDRAAFFAAVLGLLADPERRGRLGRDGSQYARWSLDDRDTLAAERAVLDGLADRRAREAGRAAGD